MRPIVLLAAATLATGLALPGFSQTESTGKDECLLTSSRCSGQVDDIQQRIRRLNREIEKGSQFYTRQELDRLNQKLQEVEQLLADLEKPGR